MQDAAITGTVNGDGADNVKIQFEPAPADERPSGENSGCSHFVAKTPFLASATVYTVTITSSLAPSGVTWQSFIPKDFAHHIE